MTGESLRSRRLAWAGAGYAVEMEASPTRGKGVQAVDHPRFEIRDGSGSRRLVATAIHAGHDLRREVEREIALTASARLREEDPYTDRIIEPAGLRVVANRSRFEVDLNRGRDDAVYRDTDDTWGLHVWKRPLPSAVIQRSLEIYDEFYARLAALLDRLADDGPFVVLDVHSYNHRRRGPRAPAAPARENPDVNVGTGTLARDRWAPVVDTLIDTLDGTEVAGQPLDVRENVRFTGANLARWVHERYPETGCALALEFKKTFMDEWTGDVDPGRLHDLTNAVEDALHAVVEVIDDER